jgi:TonB family protein
MSLMVERINYEKNYKNTFIIALIISLFAHLIIVGILVTFKPYAKKVTVFRPKSIKGYLINLSDIKKPIIESKLPPLIVKEVPKKEEKIFHPKEKKNINLDIEKKKILADIEKKIKKKKIKTESIIEDTKIDDRKSSNYLTKEMLKYGTPDGDEKGEEFPNALLNEYLSKLEAIIKSNWVIANRKIIRDNPEIEIKVGLLIDSKGKILNLKVVKSSGFEAFDTSCINAIKRSEPFPEPDKEIMTYITKEVDLKFVFEASEILKLLGEE